MGRFGLTLAPLAVGVVFGLGAPQQRQVPVDVRATPGGETANITLLDIYREGDGPQALYARHPPVEVPVVIAGMSGKRIAPGTSLSLLVDMAKWTIADGWTPGKYKVMVRANNIRVDEHMTASVMSDTVRFEIK